MRCERNRIPNDVKINKYSEKFQRNEKFVNDGKTILRKHRDSHISVTLYFR